MNFHFNWKKSVVVSHWMLGKVYGESAPTDKSYSEWFWCFKNDDFVDNSILAEPKSFKIRLEPDDTIQRPKVMTIWFCNMSQSYEVVMVSNYLETLKYCTRRILQTFLFSIAGFFRFFDVNKGWLDEWIKDRKGWSFRDGFL